MISSERKAFVSSRAMPPASMSVAHLMFFGTFCLAIPLKLVLDLFQYLFDVPVIPATAAALFLAIASVPFIPRNVVFARSFLFTIVLLAILLVSFAFLAISSKSPFNVPLAFTHLAASAGQIFVFAIAGIGLLVREEASYRALKWAFWASSLIVISFQAVLGDVWMQLNESGAYLRVSDLYAIAALLLIARSGTIAVTTIVVVVASLSILFLGSRSTLLFFLTAVAGWLAIEALRHFLAKRHAPIVKVLAVNAAVAAVGATYLVVARYFPALTDLFRMTRIGYTVFDSADYGGLGTRTEFMRAGLERIGEKVLGGSLFERIKGVDEAGDHIHNMLFVWDDFGLIAFVAMVLATGAISVSALVYRSFNGRLVAAVLFCLMSMMFTRAYAFPYLFAFASLATTAMAARAGRRAVRVQ